MANPRYFPLRTITGDSSPWVGVDLDLGTVAVAETGNRVVLHVTDAPSGANLVASIRNATGGGGDGIQVTIQDGQLSGSATGTLPLASGGHVYLRVESAPYGSGLNLQGRLELESA